jgi:hypothetical protein
MDVLFVLFVPQSKYSISYLDVPSLEVFNAGEVEALAEEERKKRHSHADRPTIPVADRVLTGLLYCPVGTTYCTVKLYAPHLQRSSHQLEDIPRTVHAHAYSTYSHNNERRQDRIRR